MLELHGLISPLGTNLKHQLLLFDRLHVLGADAILDGASFEELEQEAEDLRYLHSQGIVQPIDCPLNFSSLIEDPAMRAQPNVLAAFDMALRVRARDAAGENPDIEFSPVCHSALPVSLKPFPGVDPARASVERTFSVALEYLPLPDESCSLPDVLDFREDLFKKRWAFRRFLHTLATQKQSEAEIGDEIEWIVDEYRNAMEIHHLKTSQGFFEVYVLPAIELAEDLAKLKWSKIARGVLHVRDCRIALMEAEMKAPGRECAYVFDAQKRFDKHR